MLKKLKSKSNNFFSKSILLSFAGLILLLIAFFWKINQTDLSFNTNKAVLSYQNNYKSNNLKSISIPKTSTFLKVEEGRIVDGQWEISEMGVSHFIYSSSPGEKGNIVIYGHNKNNILGKLDELTQGDFINIYTTDKKVYTYVVGKKETVTPDRVDLIFPTSEEVLTIYTCTGIFDTKRLVIKAYPA